MVCVLPCPGKEFGLIGTGGIGVGAEHGNVHADAAAGIPILQLRFQTVDFLLFGLALLP